MREPTPSEIARAMSRFVPHGHPLLQRWPFGGAAEGGAGGAGGGGGAGRAVDWALMGRDLTPADYQRLLALGKWSDV